MFCFRLIFSQSLYSLDLIEYFLASIDYATQVGQSKESLAGNSGSWSIGLDYFRLDGSTSSENRNTWCKIFNREDNHRFVMKPSSFIIIKSSRQ
jgi:transcriptional regulator ATRX